MAITPQLDALDRKILSVLRRDGRRSFADLARDLDVSIATIKRRVDRLEETGVVQGYAAVLDTAKLGLGFEAIVELYCAERVTPRDVLGTISGMREVISAVTATLLARPLPIQITIRGAIATIGMLWLATM